MLILLAATLAATAGDPTAAARPLIPPPAAHCRDASRTVAADGTPRAGKLGDMPPAQEIKAVWRFDENGCPKPVVVRAEVGGKGR